MAVSYSVSSVTVKDQAAAAVFTVKRSGTASDLAGSSSINYATSDSTAEAGTDYTATSGTLAFASQVTEATVSVAILPAAYDESTTRTFVFSLVSSDGQTPYSNAVGSIVPSSSGNTKQSYHYVPEDNTSVPVPTATNPGDNLPDQALSSGFSAPSTPNVAMPLAYIRFGYAREDMNDYERVIVDSDTYHPTWTGKTGSGNNREPGPLQWMVRPRGLNRRYYKDPEAERETNMAKNAHLDGIQIYSDKNYTLTVADQMNTVVQGDNSLYVKGATRELLAGSTARWTWFDQDSPNRTATGVDKIHGNFWSYTISNMHRLSVTAADTIDYSLGKSFKASMSADTVATSSAKYQITNSIGLTVKGLDLSGSCDISGNYSVKLFGHDRATTSRTHTQSASESITLSIASDAERWGYTLGVKAAARTVAAAAALATIPAWLDKFVSNGSFYKDATIASLQSEYDNPFLKHTPDIVAGTSVLAAAALIAAAYYQKVTEVAPPVLPKIEMNPEGLTLSADLANSIRITPEGIYINALNLELKSTSDAALLAPVISFEGDTVGVEALDFTTSGNASVGQNLEVSANTVVSGTVTSTFIQAP